MLKKIILKNFKCFKEETDFPLGQLTLLTGINGRGKSTMLQSLLLMRQSIEHNDNAAQLVLNGSCLNLGSFNEIRNSNISREESIVFRYLYEDNIEVPKNNNSKIIGAAQYHFNENYEDDMVAQISRIEFNDEIIERDSNQLNSISYKLNSVYEKSDECNQDLHPNRFNFIFSTQEKENKNNGSCSLLKLLPFSDNRIFENARGENIEIDSKLYKSLYFDRIHYISADRVGPQEFYFKSTLTKFPNVGSKGEFTANLLHKNKDYLVNDNLCLGEDAKTLATQTEEWLNNIFDGAKVEILGSDSNILELLMNASTSKDRFRPANIGFGYHCVLPIVVSALIAKEGEMLIVENPEAHLHPKAQSRLAKFLAQVSSCGVQVFMESHSDHILNALRIAVLDKILNHEDLKILYFQQKPKQPVVEIPVQPDGGIEEWPEGFFDQMDKDFERLFGL
ncbi:hypothetical protein MC7420_2168 [Coleofasciculus chthonoplastes PCC 7420]|uniref:DUF3696 domain-containing protein n=1 Tax=Coleofasciculus chthonoplastes PCC 7420 TaxID=118168 RepID=B4VSD5_9CYAN|nr:DUF3696 domain-containing protein [Coleofasciculus chthonoplastes]EDX75164.1 hypothetical protein MC7420_2168 [Coleofasciculus chthonoplastes PCC 7420]